MWDYLTPFQLKYETSRKWIPRDFGVFYGDVKGYSWSWIEYPPIEGQVYDISGLTFVEVR